MRKVVTYEVHPEGNSERELETARLILAAKSCRGYMCYEDSCPLRGRCRMSGIFPPTTQDISIMLILMRDFVARHTVTQFDGVGHA